MDKTPEQRILELKQELIFSKKQQSKLEHELKQTNKKVVLFDMMIDVAEEELDISIKKKNKSRVIKTYAKKIKKT